MNDSTIRGHSAVADELQVGIQIRSGAGGRISGNVITDHFFIGALGDTSTLADPAVAEDLIENRQNRKG